MKENFFDNECWYKEGCQQINERCRKTCHLYLEMNFMISNCGMPNTKKYLKKLEPQKKDLPLFKQLQSIKDNIVQFVNNGDNLYILSKNYGNGKTTWALKLLYKYFDCIWNGNGFKKRGYFVYTPDFFTELRSIEFNDGKEYLEIVNFLKEVDLVVWDDIATSALKHFDTTKLTAIISYRCINGKANIFTGNLYEDEIAELSDYKLANKIWNSIRVELKGKNRRDEEC